MTAIQKLKQNPQTYVITIAVLLAVLVVSLDVYLQTQMHPEMLDNIKRAIA